VFDWRADANNRITVTLDTSTTKTGTVTLTMVNGGSSETVSATAELTPGIDVAADISFRCTSSALNIALNGTAATEVSHSIGLPDLSIVDADLGDGVIRDRETLLWSEDIGDVGIAETTA